MDPFTADVTIPKVTTSREGRKHRLENVVPQSTETLVDVDTGMSEDYHDFGDAVISEQRPATEPELSQVRALQAEERQRQRQSMNEEFARPGLEVGGNIEDRLARGSELVSAQRDTPTPLADATDPGNIEAGSAGTPEMFANFQRTKNAVGEALAAAAGFVGDITADELLDVGQQAVEGAGRGVERTLAKFNSTFIPFWDEVILPEFNQTLTEAGFDPTFEYTQAETLAGTIVGELSQFIGAGAVGLVAGGPGVAAVGLTRAGPLTLDIMSGLIADLVLIDPSEDSISGMILNKIVADGDEEVIDTIRAQFDATADEAEFIQFLSSLGEGVLIAGSFGLLGLAKRLFTQIDNVTGPAVAGRDMLPPIKHDMDLADEALEGDAALAITEFVGHGPGAVNRLDPGNPMDALGVMNARRLEGAYDGTNPALADELEAAFVPTRESIRELVGDTITLYRFPGAPPAEGAKPRQVLSWTADRGFAEHLAGVRREGRTFSEDDITRLEREFEETGIARINAAVHLEAQTLTVRDGTEVPVVMIMDVRVGGQVTDTDSVRAYLEGMNAEVAEAGAENAARRSQILTEEVPLDNVVWATNRAGQSEFIVRTPENLEAGPPGPEGDLSAVPAAAGASLAAAGGGAALADDGTLGTGDGGDALAGEVGVGDGEIDVGGLAPEETVAGEEGTEVAGLFQRILAAVNDFSPELTTQAARRRAAEIKRHAQASDAVAISVDPVALETARKEIIPTGGPLGNKITVRDVATMLMKRHLEKHGRALDINDPADRAIMRAEAVAEIRYQRTLQNSGEGWYDQDVADAFEMISRIPGMESLFKDEDRRVLMTALMGVMGNGPNPEATFKIASLNMEALLAGKPMPYVTSEGIPKGYGYYRQRKTMGPQMDLIEFLVKKFGKSGFADFWTSFHTVRELRDLRVESGIFGTSPPSNVGGLDKRVYGAKIIGEKIGNFSLASNGFDTTTKDKWNIRALGRHEGTLTSGSATDLKDTGVVDVVRGPAHAEAVDAFWSEVAAEVGVNLRDTQAMLWFHEQNLYTQLGVPSRSGAFSDGAARRIEDYNAEHGTNISSELPERSGGNLRTGDASETGRVTETSLTGGFRGFTPAERAIRSARREAAVGEGSTGGAGAGSNAVAPGVPRYERRDAGGASGSDVTYTLDEGVAANLNKAGVPTPEITELAEGTASSREFFRALTRAQKSLPQAGLQVTANAAADFDGHRLFVTGDRNAGFAISPDGDIVGVFNNAKGPHKGVAYALIQLAIAEGGRTLSGFDTYLPGLYARNGFRTVSRIKWDETQAPSGWNKEKMKEWNGGEPDVVFMVYDPDYYGQPKPTDGEMFATWDEAAEFRDRVADGREEVEGVLVNGPVATRASLNQITAGTAAAGGVAAALVGDGGTAQAALTEEAAPEPVPLQEGVQEQRLASLGVGAFLKGARKQRPPTPPRDQDIPLPEEAPSGPGVLSRGETFRADPANVIDLSTKRKVNETLEALIPGTGEPNLAASAPQIFVPAGEAGGFTADQLDAARILQQRQREIMDGLETEAARSGRETVDLRDARNIFRAIETHLDEHQSIITIRNVETATPQQANDFLRELGVEKELAGMDFNLDRIDSSDDIKRVIDETSLMLSPSSVTQSTRGLQTNAATLQMAEQLDVEVDVLTRAVGEGFNAEKMTAARLLLARSASQLEAIAQRIKDGDDSSRTLVQFRRQMAVHQAIQLQVKGAQTEVARALQSFNIPVDPRALIDDEIKRLMDAKVVGSVEEARRLLDPANELPPEILADPFKAGRINGARTRLVRTDGATERIEQLLEQVGGKASTKQLAKMLLELPEGAARNKFTGGYAAKTRAAIFSVWINGLLSGPRTHIRNIVSTQLFQMWRLPVSVTAAGFGAGRNVISQLRGRGPISDRVFFGEGAAMMYAWFNAQPQAWSLMAKAFREGEPTDTFTKLDGLKTNAISAEEFNMSGVSGQAMDVLGAIVGLPGRALMAEDEYFKAVAGIQTLYELSYRRFQANLVDGMDEDTAMSLMISDLRNPPPDLINSVSDAARYYTFTDQQTGRMATLVKDFQQLPVIGRLLMPFRNVPLNLTRNFLQNTPVSFLMPGTLKALRAGGAEADTALARITLGSGVMAGIAGISYMGGDIGMTGGGPTDPKKRQALRDQGVQPWSIKVKKGAGIIDDTVLAALKAAGLASETADTIYVSYLGIEPIGTMMAVMADVTDKLKWSDDASANEEMASYVIGALAENLQDRSFMAGISNFMEAWSGGGPVLNNYLSSLAKTAKPFSMLINTMDSMYDNRVRDLRVDPNVPAGISQLYALYHGFVNGHVSPVKHNIWGEEVRIGTDRWWEKVNPFYISEQSFTALERELVRLDVPISMPKRKIEGVDMTPEEYQRFLVVVGQETLIGGKNLKDAMAERVASFPPDFDDEKKITGIQTLYQKFLKAARRTYVGVSGNSVDLDVAENRDLALKVMTAMDPDFDKQRQLPGGF